jgi:hypothetical protein
MTKKLWEVTKTLYEIAATPLTYVITKWLKRVEKEEHYDYDVNYNPFLLK